MSLFALKYAEVIGKGLMEGVDICKAVTARLKENKASKTDDDEIARDNLEMGINEMDVEIKNLSQFEQSEDLVQKVGEYMTLRWDAQKLLNELNVRLRSGEESQPVVQSPSKPPTATPVFTRLPEIQMTKFNGDVLNWSEFWEQFCTNVHHRRDMGDDVKITYLKSFLEGEAKETIGGLRNTAENYAIAINKLQDRYAKPQRILDAHYAALDNLAPATADIRLCREVLNQIDIHMGILKSLGEDTNHNNFRRTLMKKFPPDIIHDLRLMMKTKETHSVDELRSYLQQVIEAREESSHLTKIGGEAPAKPSHFTTETLYSGQSSQPHGKTQDQQKRKRPWNRPNNQSSSRTNQNQQQSHGKTQKQGSIKLESNPADTPSNKADSTEPPHKVRRKYLCRFCKGNHYNDECDVLKTIEKRKQWFKTNRLCYQCLSNTHMTQNCDKKRKCPHCGVFGKHNRCLCPSLENKDKRNATNTLFSHTPTSTILQTATVMAVTSKGEKIPCRVLFDTGSEKSYINAGTERKLKATCKERTTLTIYTFGNRRALTRDTSLVLFSILTNQGPVEISAYVIPTTTGNIPAFTQEKNYIKRLYPALTVAADVEEDKPADIIIGNDFYYSFLTGGIQKLADHLFLLSSKLGWIVSGCFSAASDNSDSLSVLTFVQSSHTTNPGTSTPDPALQDDKIRDLWELETIGITDSPKALQDDEAIHTFNETTKFTDGRYYVKWPWAQYPPDLPINLGLALGRLKGLIKRIDADKLKQYDAVLKEQLQKGIIENIQDRTLPKTHPVHYLSHHCVIQEGKTTKLRIVYDASAKLKGQHSLNDFLYKGPLMLEELTALLLRFRTHKIGLISDIEKAFLQLGLQEADRDVTRFLWVKDISRDLTDDNIVHLRFCRVPFGVISSPFLLAATMNLHLKQKDSSLSTQMARSLYVDNLVTGADTLERAITLYNEARTNFLQLSMNIREWSSNDVDFMNHMPAHLRNDSPIVSVLGLQWDTSADILRLSIKAGKLTQMVKTKRQALRVIASVYDPCGLTAPLTLSTRLFLQSLWVKKVKWDDELTSSQQDEWKNCVKSLSAIPEVAMARYYHIPPNHKVEIHCFTDASNQCYSAVVYVRATVNDKTTVSMVISKSRLTPLRQKDKITVPKLELLAVLIGTRLVSYVQKTLDLRWSSIHLWTDSQIVLGWIKSTKLLHPFVSRRVEEIRKSTAVHFRYVPSSMNPADIATRPLMSYSMLPKIWKDGPEFLRSSTDTWPSTPLVFALGNSDLFVSDDTGITNTRETVVAMNTSSNDAGWELPEQGIALPTQTVHKIQRTFFPRETNREPTPLTTQLGLFLDSDGILRCEGRYRNAVMSYSQKYPILLPTDSIVTTTIIQRLHEGNSHVGLSHTLSLLREHYWVPKGRRVVSKVLRRCQACIKYGGGPYKLPPMPDLPRERVTYSPPFTYTGLDYLGPLVVLENGRPFKRWVCLFTCLAVRAVHLEVVHDLTSEEFVLALRRFAAMRGVPDLIISDNATHFKLTASVLASLPSSAKRIEWKFIPALSPWQGGFYERLIGLVKHCLTRTIDRSLLTGNQLTTVMKEIEAVLNTRPLTTVGSEVEHVLCPHDFLSTSGLPLLEPPLNHEATSQVQSQLILGWKRTQTFLDEFRKMFVNQYLVGLREHHQVYHRQPRVMSHHRPALGDKVQIKGDHKNRALWKVGTITSLLPSSDGQPRTAQVTLDGGSILNRSIAHLYPLEVEGPCSHADQGASSRLAANSIDTPVQDPVTACQSPTILSTPQSPPRQSHTTSEATATPATPAEAPANPRPPRNAAIQARQRIRQWVRSLFAVTLQRFK